MEGTLLKKQENMRNRQEAILRRRAEAIMISEI